MEPHERKAAVTAELMNGEQLLWWGEPRQGIMFRPADALLIPFQTPKGRRRVRIAAASLVVLYFALTIGAHGVAALGVGVAKAPKSATSSVYLGVRVDDHEI